ncbi:hypothetical protein ACFSOZ_03865 [Mesorhizobium newzealandense]|uniref:Transposase n=3 Tax=Mesorhizobium TaxID=68287 RepID=A0ABW4WEX0_9HYPH|nr:hypothetical protein [Mesorhizobium sophorae]
MKVAQDGVQAFVGHAMQSKVPFAMETVFSYWEELPDGIVHSKLDLIRDMQAAGYFVLLLFVGLANVELSILRVQTRVAEHGHDVETERLLRRFPKTQRAIGAASMIADASVYVDNSRGGVGLHGLPCASGRTVPVRSEADGPLGTIGDRTMD